jgi:hypothetical protein
VKHETILCISGGASSGASVMIDLEAAGYEVVRADSSTEGIALSYLMHPVAGVVIHC